jgi:hypothetical protein
MPTLPPYSTFRTDTKVRGRSPRVGFSFLVSCDGCLRRRLGPLAAHSHEALGYVSVDLSVAMGSCQYAFLAGDGRRNTMDVSHGWKRPCRAHRLLGNLYEFLRANSTPPNAVTGTNVSRLLRGRSPANSC